MMGKIQRIVVCLMIAAVGASDVCDSTCSCLDYESEYFIVNCKGFGEHVPDIDFEMFEWPTSANRTTKAFFNNMAIHLLPKMVGDSNVISVNFDDNLIRTLPSNPFEYFTNLESISVANNVIDELTFDFLKSPVGLKVLNLANNSLSSIHPKVLEHLKLIEIDLSFNHFTKLSADLLEALSSVEIMRLQGNQMFTIDSAFGNVEYNLQQIFLADNQFKVITGAMFEKFTKLGSIDLSSNMIDNIDENAFSKLVALKLLDLSNNVIRRVRVVLPESLELLTMANNKLESWPLANLPENLNELELQNNNLEIIFPKQAEVEMLRSLDVSHNIIQYLPNTQFFKLDKFDLSYNQLTIVPQNLNSMTPMLRDLVLDGNPISSVFFSKKTMLQSLSLSYMPNLERLESEAFINLSGVKMSPDESGTCVDIHVAHNKYLWEIDSRAFEGVSICQLDLSYNSLVTIPRNLTDWELIREGIDLQGNPLSCNCEDQWMLNEILDKLFEKLDTQFLLQELKCQSPENLKDQKFVHFRKHDNPFCDSSTLKEKVLTSGFGIFSFEPPDDSKDVNFQLTQGPGFIIIIVMCALILIAMIFLGIRWQRQQDQKLARRNRLYGYDYD